MKIGIFDSGLGGLYLLKAISKKLPRYDYVFLGDTKNQPFGEKTNQQIYQLTKKAVEFLFRQNCQIVIIACNTSSAQALRRLQREFLPKHYPTRRVLGIIRPTVEVIESGTVCVLATTFTATKSKVYSKELHKLKRGLKVSEFAAPELATWIEQGQSARINQAIQRYAQLVLAYKPKNLILGCSHYAIVKAQFARRLGRGVNLISQDEIVPSKLHDYLHRHPEIQDTLSQKHSRRFYVTKMRPIFARRALQWFGKKIKLELVKY